MNNMSLELKQMTPTKDFLVAIDSDGCVFDVMHIKQSECFCPMMIAHFGLQPVAKAARECKMFADLYSKTRGANRHKTLVRVLKELLPSHPVVNERRFNVPMLNHYFAWVNDQESQLSDAGLKKTIEKSSNTKQRNELQKALKWSQSVNSMVAEIVTGVPPFSFVRRSLRKISSLADIIVCSATPKEALKREWTEHGLASFVKVIAGQEMGSKSQHLGIVSNGMYDKDKILMLGDAPGDLHAAWENGVHFYPIIPGNEDSSWKRFHDDTFDEFIQGGYAGASEDSEIAEFDKCLTEYPGW